MMLLITLATRRRHRCHNKPNRKYSNKSMKYSLKRRSKQTNKYSVKCRPLNKHNFQREREYIVCPGDLHTYLDVIIFKYIEKEH